MIGVKAWLAYEINKARSEEGRRYWAARYEMWRSVRPIAWRVVDHALLPDRNDK